MKKLIGGLLLTMTLAGCIAVPVYDRGYGYSSPSHHHGHHRDRYRR